MESHGSAVVSTASVDALRTLRGAAAHSYGPFVLGDRAIGTMSSARRDENDEGRRPDAGRAVRPSRLVSGS
jgi:hypothetical protein